MTDQSARLRGLASGVAVGALLALACGSNASAGSGAPEPPTASAPEPVAALHAEAHPLGREGSHERILEWVGDARIVLLGEASHGTHEFYELRAELTQALIERGELDAVAIEGDWPSAARVDRYVRGGSSDGNAAEALSDFDRFPRWMWRNEVVASFVEWLRTHNAKRPSSDHVGLYGLDLYSPAESAAAVLAELDARAPAAADHARATYACLLEGGDEPSNLIANLADRPSCPSALKDELDRVTHLTGDDLDATQNARVVANAGRYWNAQRTGAEPSWNVRDSHMADTMDRLLATLGSGSRIAVWAHNSHLGDARATEMSLRGEHNLGQLMRERHGETVFNLGFSTHRGQVTAVDDWGHRTQRKTVRPGRTDSYEGLLHAVARHPKAMPAYALTLRDPAVRAALLPPRLSRAIGVIYRPETELQSHYSHSRLPDQFDALIHIDETTALRPLDALRSWREASPTS